MVTQGKTRLVAFGRIVIRVRHCELETFIAALTGSYWLHYITKIDLNQTMIQSLWLSEPLKGCIMLT